MIWWNDRSVAYQRKCDVWLPQSSFLERQPVQPEPVQPEPVQPAPVQSVRLPKRYRVRNVKKARRVKNLDYEPGKLDQH